jgi:N-acetylneuraminic acid mutarotase
MVAHGNYLYAFGGFAYEESTSPKWKSIDAIDRYDITTNTWETIGIMPRRRSSNQAVKVGTKVYLVGGWDATPKTPGDLEGTFHSAIDIFDLETEIITEARWQLPQPLRRAFTALEHEGNIILIGGLGVGSSHFELLNNVTLLDPQSGYTRELNPLPFSTFAPAAGILGNELLVFGGMFKTGPMNYEYVSHIYGMNLKTEAWTHTGRYLVETKGFSQVVPFQNGLAILGGHRYFADRDEPVRTFEFIFR